MTLCDPSITPSGDWALGVDPFGMGAPSAGEAAEWCAKIESYPE